MVSILGPSLSSSSISESSWMREGMLTGVAIVVVVVVVVVPSKVVVLVLVVSVTIWSGDWQAFLRNSVALLSSWQRLS